MNNHLTYLVLMLSSLAGPLLLSFDKKVAYYQKWKFLFPALLLPALLYIIWDIYFTSIGVWSFSTTYTTGVRIANLPIEEVLFFFIVPYCCVFIYECIRSYFPQLSNKRVADYILMAIALLLLAAAFIWHNRYYTSWTAGFTAFFIFLIYLRKKWFASFDATAFLVAYAIILIPFLIVNGVLTALPVVLYNNVQNLGIRIWTIPVEDIFYGMLLILMNIAFYEKLLKRN